MSYQEHAQLYTAESWERLRAAVEEALGTGAPYELDIEMVRTDGTTRWLTARGEVQRDSAGRIVQLRGTVHDITKRKRDEESLGLFRSLIDGSNDAFEVIDPGTLRFLDVNEKACRDLGYSREELLSLTVFDIDPTFDESVRTALKTKFRESGYVIFESEHRRKDGSTYPVEVNLKHVMLDRGLLRRRRSRHLRAQAGASGAARKRGAAASGGRSRKDVRLHVGCRHRCRRALRRVRSNSRNRCGNGHDRCAGVRESPPGRPRAAAGRSRRTEARQASAANQLSDDPSRRHGDLGRTEQPCVPSTTKGRCCRSPAWLRISRDASSEKKRSPA